MPDNDNTRPLTGRELSEMHKALVNAGASQAFTLRWLRNETDLWEAERAATCSVAEDETDG